MASEQSLWFRIGYALERARHPSASAGRKLTGLAQRKRKKRLSRHTEEDGQGPSTDDLVSAGLVLAAAKVLEIWRPRHKAKLSTLLRAATAGAGAALLLDLVRPLITGRPSKAPFDAKTGERLLTGAGQGLLYGAVVEPRLRGSALVKGALFAAAEYAAHPAGGLSKLMGTHAPQRRVPLLGHLLDDLEAHERTYLEHLTFAIALAVLYESSPSNNGTPVEDDDE
jgi:hypothetical protein